MTVPAATTHDEAGSPQPSFAWPDVLFWLLIALLIAGLVYGATRGTGAVGVGPF